MQSIRKQLIQFANQFPLDKKFRDSRGIIFGSEEHRKVCQIDLYCDFVEGELYDEAMEAAMVEQERREQLAKGIIVKEKVIDKVEEDKLFEKLKSNFANIKFEDAGN